MEKGQDAKARPSQADHARRTDVEYIVIFSSSTHTRPVLVSRGSVGRQRGQLPANVALNKNVVDATVTRGAEADKGARGAEDKERPSGLVELRQRRVHGRGRRLRNGKSPAEDKRGRVA